MDWLRRVGRRVRPGEAEPWDGRPVDIDRYWAEAWTELKARQDFIARGLRLANADWSVDQEAGLIQFERQDGSLLAAPVQIVGSWSPQSHLFTWGWGHPSVRVRLRAGAERTRWFGDKHGLPEFCDPQFKATEDYAWRLTAVAMKVNGAIGAYRGPTADGPVVFMTLGDIKVLAAPDPARSSGR